MASFAHWCKSTLEGVWEWLRPTEAAAVTAITAVFTDSTLRAVWTDSTLRATWTPGK